ncbi:MAG TPA: hypothetical protein VNX68_12275 [Nitrosopumilaceae archaeon]|jgi:hypothetical protein|nr:hypothetical protein [Nitrosopumilaceae archaeon]
MKEKLLKLFQSAPFALRYDYRRKAGSLNTYKQDKPFLDELIKEGKIFLEEKNTKTITYTLCKQPNTEVIE